MGVSLGVLQEFLGHEVIATIMHIYTQLMDPERRATSDAMGDILEKSGFCSEKCSESPDGKVIRFGDIA